MTIGHDPVASSPIAASPQDLLPIDNSPFFDVSITILSQYANSPVIRQLIDDFSQWLDPASRFDAFYRQIWSIDLATGFGLDLWGRILGVNRVLRVARSTFLGFESDPAARPFGFGILYSGRNLTDNVALTDEAYRRLLLAKAALNITDASIPAINRILLDLFEQGYVRDNLDMSLTYVFATELTDLEQAIVFQSGVLPKPCGVSFTVEQP